MGTGNFIVDEQPEVIEGEEVVEGSDVTPTPDVIDEPTNETSRGETDNVVILDELPVISDDDIADDEASEDDDKEEGIDAEAVEVSAFNALLGDFLRACEEGGDSAHSGYMILIHVRNMLNTGKLSEVIANVKDILASFEEYSDGDMLTTVMSVQETWKYGKAELDKYNALMFFFTGIAEGTYDLKSVDLNSLSREVGLTDTAVSAIKRVVEA